MTLNNEKTKDVFLSNNKETILLMLDYLKKSLDISEAKIWNFIGYYVIEVPFKDYEKALLNGRKFACEKDIGLYWVNILNIRRGPIAACDIGYAILPNEYIPGEKENGYFDRNLWGSDVEHTPEIILDYFDSMKEYLNVDKIISKYYASDEALSITTLASDFEEKSKLFREFVENNGFGPFKEIYPLSFSGEYNKQPILVKKKTSNNMSK